MIQGITRNQRQEASKLEEIMGTERSRSGTSFLFFTCDTFYSLCRSLLLTHMTKKWPFVILKSKCYMLFKWETVLSPCFSGSISNAWDKLSERPPRVKCPPPDYSTVTGRLGQIGQNGQRTHQHRLEDRCRGRGNDWNRQVPERMFC